MKMHVFLYIRLQALIYILYILYIELRQQK